MEGFNGFFLERENGKKQYKKNISSRTVYIVETILPFCLNFLKTNIVNYNQKKKLIFVLLSQ